MIVRAPMEALKWVALGVLSLCSQVQAAAYPPPSTNCTETSSKAASWEIRNFTFDSNSKLYFGPGNAGKVSFSIKNSANGYAFDCLQGNSRTGRVTNRFLRDGIVWYGCNVYCYGAQGIPLEDNPPLATSFSFDIETRALSVSQTWSCGSGNAVTNYTATGTSIIPSANLSCPQVPGGRTDQVSCAPFDVTIKAKNFTIGEIPLVDEPFVEEPYISVDSPGESPFLPPRPPADPSVKTNTPGCNKRSQEPSWTVSDIRNVGARVRFTLTNTALNYTQKCNLQDAGSGSEVRPQNCTQYDTMHANYPYHRIFTTVLYGGNQNLLGINETWYCDDEDANNPTVHTAYAETKLLVKCNETRTCTPPGRFDVDPSLSVQTICGADDLTLEPAQMRSFHVSKAQAAEDFKPRGYNCSSRSLGETGGPPVWEVSSFSFARTSVSGWNTTTSFDVDEASFTFRSTATDSDWPASGIQRRCSRRQQLGDKVFDGTEELVCDGIQMGDRSFKFDFNSSTLTLHQEWTCDGTDRFHTNVFKAMGTARLPLQCAPPALNATRCSVPDKVVVPMANLTKTLNVETAGDYRVFK